MYDIEKELALYRFRKFEIEDMKLKIEQLEVGAQLKSINFDEKVQTSMKYKDNGYVMEEIARLEKKIQLNEIANKRVDNALTILTYKEDLEVVKKVLIEKLSINRASHELNMSRKSIKNSLDKALAKLKECNKETKVS
jgi:predicted DNA-binding protein (UPF0251 family)